MSLTFAAAATSSVPLVLLEAERVAGWCSDQPDHVQTWVDAQGFDGALGSVLAVPGQDGRIECALAGFGTQAKRARGRFHLAAERAKLPAGTYHLETTLTDDALDAELLGWLLAGYRFDRYAKASAPKAELICPEGADAVSLEARAAGEALTRDLINTPASDMGPPDLEDAARKLADAFSATIEVTTGDALLDANYPMIHAVGRAASRAPRLIDMHWGTSGPRLTLVGKGVCFDTGGLNVAQGPDRRDQQYGRRRPPCSGRCACACG